MGRVCLGPAFEALIVWSDPGCLKSQPEGSEAHAKHWKYVASGKTDRQHTLKKKKKKKKKKALKT